MEETHVHCQSIQDRLSRFYVIQVFAPIIAAVLVVVAAMTGFVIGTIFVLLWNWLHRP